jgi:SAM-dependent methyltransferase
VSDNQVRVDEPSPWVVRFAPLVPPRGTVLDVACGRGRHTRFFLERGHRVVAIDRNVSGIADLMGNPQLEAIQLDLEHDEPFPARRFEGVVVTNYLFRPLLPDLVEAVARGGVLIYETYAKGHERLGSPANPDFLLDPGELLEAVRGRLEVIAYEAMESEPRSAIMQHICAVNTRDILYQEMESQE